MYGVKCFVGEIFLGLFKPLGFSAGWDRGSQFGKSTLHCTDSLWSSDILETVADPGEKWPRNMMININSCLTVFELYRQFFKLLILQYTPASAKTLCGQQTWKKSRKCMDLTEDLWTPGSDVGGTCRALEREYSVISHINNANVYSA